MSEYPQVAGKTTIAPEVLLTIARLTTLKVSGVSRMVAVPPSMERLLKKGVQQGEGVCLEIVDDTVYIDLYLVLKSELNVRDVSRCIQHDVARAISELVGMNVGGVNVHIEDIDYPEEEQVPED